MILGDVAKLVADVENRWYVYVPWALYSVCGPCLGACSQRITIITAIVLLWLLPREFAGLPDAFGKRIWLCALAGITHKWPLDRICKTDERLSVTLPAENAGLFARIGQ